MCPRWASIPCRPRQQGELGNYPIVNVYANFHLKQTRFFIMMSHVNEVRQQELFPRTPLPAQRQYHPIRLSWNFIINNTTNITIMTDKKILFIGRSLREGSFNRQWPSWQSRSSPTRPQ
jgi:hypothetical protein